MQKNVAGQKLTVFAFDRTDNTPKTGDAANITANIKKDGGAAAATNDVNPTELEDGYYEFDATQAESNADLIRLFPASSTADIQVIGVPPALWTRPANFPALGIESDGDLTKVNTLHAHVAQTGDSYARIGATGSGLTSLALASVCTVARLSELDVGTAGKMAYEIQNLYDNQGNWSTATGFSTHSVADVWDRIISKANHNIGQSAGKMLRELGVLVAAEGAVSGTPTTTSITTNITGYDDNFFKDQVLAAYNGAAQAGQGRVVLTYTGSTGVFTFDEPFTTAMISGDDVVIFTPHVHSQSEIGAAVWAETTRTLSSGANIALTKGVGLIGLTDLSAAQVNAQVDLALNTAIPSSPTAGSVNEVLKDQARSAATIVEGAAVAGTLSTTEMTTDLVLTVDEQLSGRILIFAADTATPALRNQATDITASAVANGKLTFTAVTNAPSAGDTFVVV